MSKYTPGPWSTNEWPQATTDIAIGAVGTPLVAKVPLRDVSINEQVSNALLITAAPELLGALKAIVKSLADQDEEGLIEHAEQMIAARAAIAKAEGPVVQRLPSDDTEGGAA